MEKCVSKMLSSTSALKIFGVETAVNACYLMEELKMREQVFIRQDEGGCAWANSTSNTITFSGVLFSSEGISMVGGRYSSRTSHPLPDLGHKVNVSGCPGQKAALFIVAITMLLWCRLLE